MTNKQKVEALRDVLERTQGALSLSKRTKKYEMTEHLLNFNSIDMVVVGEYEPAESTTMYYTDMSGHLGTPHIFSPIEIYVGEVNIFELLPQSTIEKISEQILEKYY